MAKFLIPPKPGTKTTGHLNVSDRRHAGAAYAALFKNYRGNSYQGPDKEALKRKLRALYRRKGWPWPGDKEKKSHAAKFVLGGKKK
jgi:hypothetical protein